MVSRGDEGKPVRSCVIETNVPDVTSATGTGTRIVRVGDDATLWDFVGRCEEDGLG